MQAGNTTHFGGEDLAERLCALPQARRYWVGFSGGADSTALLQMMHEARERLAVPVQAVHFNHGLQPEAKQWERHCETFCRERTLPFTIRRLDIENTDGESPEEAARNARYLDVACLLGPQELYLTAHHAEDHAETLLINLVRGSGIEGLAAIPRVRSLGEGWVARPLLDVSRKVLVDYLQQRGIAWLEDPSNADTVFDRNFIRHEVLPLLEQRWPGVKRNIARTASHAQGGAQALSLLIERQSGDLLHDPHRMPLGGLLECERDLQPLILRQWLRRHEVPMVPSTRLEEFLCQLRDAGESSRSEVQWGGWAIRRYRDELWLQAARAIRACPERNWTRGMSLDLGEDAGHYRLRGESTPLPENWRVSPRQPKDRLRPRAGGPSRKIKDLFQRAGVPPWLRLGIPVLYWDDVPVALGDWVLEDRLQRWLNAHRLELVWEPKEPTLARIRRNNNERVKKL